MLLHRFPSVTTPAETAEASAQTTTVAVVRSRLVRVEIMVPPGHRGETGIRLELDGTPIVPFEADEWLTADNETFDSGLDFDLAAGRLDVVTFNTDIVEHTHYLRLHLETLRSGRVTADPPVIDVQGLLGEVEPVEQGETGEVVESIEDFLASLPVDSTEEG